MKAAKRQKEQLLELKRLQCNRKNEAQINMAKIMRGWYARTTYLYVTQLTHSVKIVQRAYRCRLARKDLFLRLVGFENLMNNSIVSLKYHVTLLYNRGCNYR